MGGVYDWFDAMVDERGEGVAVARLTAFAKKSKAWGPPHALGYSLFGIGRKKAAVEAFRLAYRRNPSEKTLYALSTALLVAGRADESIKLLLRHDRKSRITARPLVTLANAYHARGERAKAEAALRRIRPSDREGWETLVDSAWQRLRWGGR